MAQRKKEQNDVERLLSEANASENGRMETKEHLLMWSSMGSSKVRESFLFILCFFHFNLFYRFMTADRIADESRPGIRQ